MVNREVVDQRCFSYCLGDDFIERFSADICRWHQDDLNDLSRIACVFGGKRPALFLRRALSRRIGRPFYPPAIFSIDQFIDHVVSKDLGDVIQPLDAAHFIYTLCRRQSLGILRRGETFSEFLPWAVEIVSFIEQLDLEMIDDDALVNIEKSAQIGYEIPESINSLLENLRSVRRQYHRMLRENNLSCRGWRYLHAARVLSQKELKEFDTVYFANFFYLHKSEDSLIRELFRKGQAVCIFQGDEKDWSVLKLNAQRLNVRIVPEPKEKNKPAIHIWAGFDMHSQVCRMREIVKGLRENVANSVIVVPRPESIVPLMNEIGSCVDEVNVSLGYPLRRTALFVLFDSLRRVQETKKDGLLYTRDYLQLVRHPLVKNLKQAHSPAVTRIVVHKLEEFLSGIEKSAISGSLFVSLDDLEKEEAVFEAAAAILGGMGIEAGTNVCRDVLKQVHRLFLRQWEDVSDFTGFAERLDVLLQELVARSMVDKFPLALKGIEKIQQIAESMKAVSFTEERFVPREIWEIFHQQLQEKKIAFHGSPLKGLQVLGLFETRSLNFENVLIMDLNESVLPKMTIYEPLIPREVMLNLGLNRLEKEEEIQRYQFRRLISSGKQVHLVYEENREKEKSRFIEEIIWEKQRQMNQKDVYTVPQTAFSMKVKPPQIRVEKTGEMIEFLRDQEYSASRLNTYLNCPLQFYYRYVLGLKEREDMLVDPQGAVIGTFIHELLQDTFAKFKGKKPVIDKRFESYFLKTLRNKFEAEITKRMKSDSYLLEKIIVNRMKKFLENERRREVERIICLEESRQDTIKVAGRIMRFTYTVDRVDQVSPDEILILDYKTGGSDIAPRRFSYLAKMGSDRVSLREGLRSFQMPLYRYFVRRQFPDARGIHAELYNLRTLERHPFISEKDAPHTEAIMKIAEEALESIFAEIFDIEKPFVADRDDRRCQYCDFKGLC